MTDLRSADEKRDDRLAMVWAVCIIAAGAAAGLVIFLGQEYGFVAVLTAGWGAALALPGAIAFVQATRVGWALRRRVKALQAVDRDIAVQLTERLNRLEGIVSQQAATLSVHETARARLAAPKPAPKRRRRK